MLYVAEDLGYINDETAKSLREQCTNLSIKITSFMSKFHEYDTKKKQQRSLST